MPKAVVVTDLLSVKGFSVTQNPSRLLTLMGYSKIVNIAYGHEGTTSSLGYYFYTPHPIGGPYTPPSPELPWEAEIIGFLPIDRITVKRLCKNWDALGASDFAALKAFRKHMHSRHGIIALAGASMLGAPLNHPLFGAEGIGETTGPQPECTSVQYGGTVIAQTHTNPPPIAGAYSVQGAASDALMKAFKLDKKQLGLLKEAVMDEVKDNPFPQQPKPKQPSLDDLLGSAGYHQAKVSGSNADKKVKSKITGKEAEEMDNGEWGTFNPNDMWIAKTKDLIEARALYTPVHGTSPTSRYFLIAASEGLRVAARWNNAGLSMRVEGKDLVALDSDLTNAGFEKKGEAHWSIHVKGGDTMIRKTVGAMLFALNEPWKTSWPQLDLLHSTGPLA